MSIMQGYYNPWEYLRPVNIIASLSCINDMLETSGIIIMQGLLFNNPWSWEVPKNHLTQQGARLLLETSGTL